MYGSQSKVKERFRSLWLFLAIAAVCVPCHAARAQGLDPTGRSGDRPVELQPGLPEKAPLVVPPLPPAPEPPKERPSEPAGEAPAAIPPGSVLPPLEPEPRTRLGGQRIFVRKIEVEGNTVLSPEALREITAPYENRDLTAEDLENLRLALTRLYISKGYVNSGATLPDQKIAGGVITYKIVEGQLSRIDLEGNKWLRDYFISSRLRLSARPPLNINSLQERLQLLLQNPNIERMNAELKPGVKPGESILKVNVEDRQPFRFATEYNNFQSPTVGPDRGLGTLIAENVTGLSDMAYFQYGRSDGLNPLIDTFYRIPFTPYDTTFQFRYRKNDFGVVQADFQPLNITTDSDIFGITFRQPFWRTLNQEFGFEIIGEYESSQSFLGGRGFSFTPGTRSGQSIVTALRLAPDWVRRSANQVFATRFQFTFGLPIFGATENNISGVPDAQFFAWAGQFQWARRFEILDWGMETLARTNVQLTGDPLFPLEQISIGGRYSVRGYWENQIVRDNGVVSQFELRVPIVEGKRWADYIQLAPFFDIGTGWSASGRRSGPSMETLYSIGVGVRYAVTVRRRVPTRFELEFYWGSQLKSVDNPGGGGLQDYGISLRVGMAMF